MRGSVIFDPLLPWPLLAALAAFALALLVFAIWRRLGGWWLRALAMLVLGAALANPSFQQENRTPLNDVVLLMVDRTASQGISDRPDQIAAAVQGLEARLAARPNLDVKTLTLDDAPGDGGTLLMTKLVDALSEIPQSRLAGALLVTDGQVHDLASAPAMVAPSACAA